MYLIPDANGCHTDAITIPGIHEEVKNVRYKDFIILASRFMRSWKEPLESFITEANKLPKVQDDILTKSYGDQRSKLPTSRGRREDIWPG
ncbi:PREDICTED: prolactin-like [Chinchilla lanigera]|uniref:prolactin-like n=1 Tax=Chinchilla lanigera TaxID=34839 RepID=UPI00038EEBFC|nr:PREDICTED: prolactin-like [Chinchilla lanigera]